MCKSLGQAQHESHDLSQHEDHPREVGPDLLGLMMAHEQGELDVDGTLELFSELIRTGQAWSLQGSYGRAARGLIDRGYITEDGAITYGTPTD